MESLPAFDLNPDPRPGPKYLSTAIDFEDTRANIDTLLGVADHFRLNSAEALDVLGDVERAAARWRDVALSHELKQPELDVMEPAFEHSEADRARGLTARL